MREGRTSYNIRSRRRRRIRRQKMVAAWTLAFFLFSGLFVFGITARASVPAQKGQKYFTSVLVMPGDTLSSIAARYADGHYASREAYIEEVCETNHIRNRDSIDAGAYLIVPYYGSGREDKR